MKVKRMLLGLLFCAGLLAMAGCSIPIPTIHPLTKIDTVEEVQTVSLGSASRAEVKLRLLSESLVVQPAIEPDFFTGTFRYNVQEWSPKIDQTIESGTLKLTVGQGLGSQIPFGQGDEYDNAWAVKLNPGVPMDLSVDMASGTADLDLTGLSITRLVLTTGKADVGVVFNAVNPEPLGMLRVTAGTGKTTMTGLGNANFDQVNIIGGAGSVNLDFSGALTRSAVVDIKAGAGEFDIRVPDAVGVRVTYIGTPISTMSTTGFSELAENIYVNAAYGNAALTLTIKI
ncbi:MAG: toast rack family protein, partial [Anaerolineae bacterium]|nr:toast rack family protein [Anaerolineae bacterium]